MTHATARACRARESQIAPRQKHCGSGGGERSTRSPCVRGDASHRLRVFATRCSVSLGITVHNSARGRARKKRKTVAVNVEAQSTDAQPQHERLCCVRSHTACNVNSPRACAAWQGEGARRDEATPARVLLSLSCFLSCTQPESDGRVAAAPTARASTSAAVCCCEPTAAASWKDKNSCVRCRPKQALVPVAPMPRDFFFARIRR